MRVETYQSDRLDDLTGLFNQSNEGIPHAWRVTPAELRQGMLGPQRWGHGTHVTEDPAEIVLVTEDKQLIGFIQAAQVPADLVPLGQEAQPRVGYIRAIGFPSDRGDIGWRLITTAEDNLRRQGCDVVRAFGGPLCGYRFSTGCGGGLSQRSIHARVLMVEAGYREVQSEALMEAALHAAPAPPPLGAGIQVRETQRQQGGITQSGCQLNAGSKTLATCWWYPHSAVAADTRAAGWAHLAETVLDPEASNDTDNLRSLLLWAAELMRRQNLSHLSARVPLQQDDVIELYRGVGLMQVDRCLGYIKEVR